MDTSTPATTLLSEHVPETVTGLPGTNALCTGVLMMQAGAILSVEAIAVMMFACFDPAAAPISNNTL